MKKHDKNRRGERTFLTGAEEAAINNGMEDDGAKMDRKKKVP
jgi:hypothetical protein